MDVHWARLEASTLGSLIVACPHGREDKRDGQANAMSNMQKMLLQFTTLVYIKIVEYLTGTEN